MNPTSLTRTGSLLRIVALTTAMLCNVGLAQSNYDPLRDEGLQAVVDAQKSNGAKIQPDVKANDFPVTARNVLEEKLRSAGIKTGWDAEKNRYAGVAIYQFQMENTEMEEYFRLRQLGSLGAMVVAQRDLALWMGTKASMSVSVNNPGDPFKLRVDERLMKLKADLKRAKETANKLGAQLDQTQQADLDHVSTPERLKSAQAAVMQKLGTNSNTEEISRLNAEFNKAVAELENLSKDFESYQSNYTKRRTESSVRLTFDHYIFGMAAVSWAENVTADGVLQTAVAYVWSPKLAQAASAALMGETSAPQEIKGAKSLNEWIAEQDLTTLGAFRYYIDDRGERWFLGCSARAGGDDEAIAAADLSAIQNLYLPLTAKLVGVEEQKMIALDGKKGSSAKEDLARWLNARGTAETRGVDRVLGKDVYWPSKNLTNNKKDRVQATVQVYALAGSNAGAALKAMVESSLRTAQYEREKNRRILENQQSNALVENSKRESAPLKTELTKPAATSNPQMTETIPAKKNPKEKQVPQAGTKVTPGNVQDDF